ncbi:MAG: hypothetical protein JWN17_2817, partial [Frankiales bacterium]|nr:hypothetical protein [Frankiales bacterium]
MTAAARRRDAGVLPARKAAMRSTGAGLTPVPLAPAPSARALQLDVSRRLDGLLQGDHLGFLPGPGSEPAEARVYAPGDDVRRIDWAVTARTSSVHVRDAVAERELETTLLVDLTASMSFGTATTEKREVAIAVAAAFGHLAGGPGDRLGAVVLGDAVRRVRARAGREASLALLHLLLETPRVTTAGPSLAEGLVACASPPRRRGLQVVVSDLLEPGDGTAEPAWSAPLRRLTVRHEVVVVEVVDPRELELPAVGTLRLVDPETGRQVEVHTGAAMRQRYAVAAADGRERHAALFRCSGA